MKTFIQKKSIILLVGITIFMLTSCEKTGDDTSGGSNLLGTWTQTAQTIDITIGSQTFVEYLMETEGITEEEAGILADQLLALFGTENSFSTITFTSDGKYVIKASGMADDTGTWKLSDDEKHLLIDEGTVDEANIEVLVLTSTKCEIRTVEDISEDFEVEGAQMTMTISFTK